MEEYPQNPRDQRQLLVAEWVVKSFGSSSQYNHKHRGIRLLEEAIELYQAVGGDAETAHRLVKHVFLGPPGKIGQEIGGVGMTLLSLADAVHLSADAEEAKELARVLEIPTEHFKKREKYKRDAGFDGREDGESHREDPGHKDNDMGM